MWNSESSLPPHTTLPFPKEKLHLKKKKRCCLGETAVSMYLINHILVNFEEFSYLQEVHLQGISKNNQVGWWSNSFPAFHTLQHKNLQVQVVPDKSVCSEQQALFFRYKVIQSAGSFITCCKLQVVCFYECCL